MIKSIRLSNYDARSSPRSRTTPNLAGVLLRMDDAIGSDALVASVSERRVDLAGLPRQDLKR